MGCPRTVYVFLLLCSYFVLAEAGRGRQAVEEIRRRQTQARKSMEGHRLELEREENELKEKRRQHIRELNSKGMESSVEVKRLKDQGLGNKDPQVAAAVTELLRLKALLPEPAA